MKKKMYNDLNFIKFGLVDLQSKKYFINNSKIIKRIDKYYFKVLLFALKYWNTYLKYFSK